MSDLEELREMGAPPSLQSCRSVLSFPWGGLLTLLLVACGRSPGEPLADPGDASVGGGGEAGPNLAPPGPPLENVDLGARFVVALGSLTPAEEDEVYLNAIFFTGPDCGPSLCHTTVRLTGASPVSVNGIPLPGQLADWGYSYSSRAAPESPDGVYRFRVDLGRGTVTHSIALRRIRLEEPLALHAGENVIRWSPPLPTVDGVEISLSGCVTTTVRALTTSSATLSLAPSTSPCRSILSVAYRPQVPVGAPFRTGTAFLASVAAREVVVP